MHEKLKNNEAYAKKMVRVRSSTVEPVLGTLINFRNMKRINTRGIRQANKHILMAAIAYNLHKYLRFEDKSRKAESKLMEKAQKVFKNRLKSRIFRQISTGKVIKNNKAEKIAKIVN